MHGCFDVSQNPIEQNIRIDWLTIEFEIFHALGLGGDGDCYRTSDQTIEGQRVDRLDRLSAVEGIQIDIQYVGPRFEVINADAP